VKSFEHCLLLRVGVVAKGSRCVSIVRMLDSFKPSGLRLKLVALAPTSKSVSCLKFAGEIGIPIYDSYMDLFSTDALDLILEMTGNPKIFADLIRRKSPSVVVLDRQASMLFFDIARQYEMVAERESEIGLATSFASALLEASPDGVMVLDCNYRIINCNNSALITGGQPREAILGKYCYTVMHGMLNPCTGKDRFCPTQETMRTRRPSRAVHEVTTIDGEIRVIQVIVFPLFNMLGDIIQFVEIVRDITSDLSAHVEHRAQAMKNDLARVAQEDRLTSLGRLVASVCHEINNPISSIVTFNKLILSHIRDDTLPPEGLAAFEKYLDLSVKEALRCGEIVKTLLTFARQKKIESDHIDLLEMVKTIILLTGYQLQMAGVNVSIQLPEGPFTAWGDYALMQQCLMNLVFNAIESMSTGGTITITGGKSTKEKRVWLSITDTGHGINPEDLPRIFEPFYSTKGNGKGVGLGLSMVYGIIREHNGTIDVQSEQGRGTTFTMVLPAEPAAKPPS
ncbi:MAG: ATP-binding protein, partial [Desulfatitalea sp.]